VTVGLRLKCSVRRDSRVRNAMRRVPSAGRSASYAAIATTMSRQTAAPGSWKPRRAASKTSSPAPAWAAVPLLAALAPQDARPRSDARCTRQALTQRRPEVVTGVVTTGGRRRCRFRRSGLSLLQVVPVRSATPRPTPCPTHRPCVLCQRYVVAHSQPETVEQLAGWRRRSRWAFAALLGRDRETRPLLKRPPDARHRRWITTPSEPHRTPRRATSMPSKLPSTTARSDPMS
jgi:hypothetical protein